MNVITSAEAHPGACSVCALAPVQSECSQMETHVSGVKIASVGKRDSLLSRAGELKEKNTPSKPIVVRANVQSPFVKGAYKGRAVYTRCIALCGG